MLTDDTGTIWVVDKQADQKICRRMVRENYEMGLVAAEEELINQVAEAEESESK